MLNSNTFYKIISVVIAICLWAYVIEATNPMKTQTFTDIPVQLLNEDNLTSKGLALSGEATYTIDVEVQGKRSVLAKLSEAEFVANADLFGYSIGKNYIPVTLKVPDGITIIQSDPSKINVVIEELVEVAKPIEISFIGQFEDGIEAGQITTMPEEIQVSGAKSEVNAVAYVRAEVNTSKLSTEAATIQAKAVAVNSAGDVVKNVRLSSSYVDVTARLSEVKEVPLAVGVTGEVAPIYEVTNISVPDSIKIKGTKEALAGITSLTAAAIDISSVASTSKIPLDIPLPDGVEFADGSEDTGIAITIKPIATKEFVYTANEILLEGVDGAASDITITTPQITVTASGSEAVIAGLNKSDLQPYVTLDAESLISATAKVEVRYNKTLGHITVDPETIHITLNQTQ
jgi:YbbR domain-containing protein